MDGRINYDHYHMSWRQRLVSCAVGIMGAAAIVLIFYRNIWLILAGGLLGGVLFPYLQKKRLIEKRKEQLQAEFKEALYSLTVALRAGRSLEGAFAAALEDMDPSISPYIFQEWKTISAQLQIGFQVEECLVDLGQRSGIEEIISFARTIEVCKRSEGDVAKVMENTIHLLQDRMEIQNELKVLLAKKKTEQKILNLMPFVVIILLLMMSPDYLEPLYESLQGRLIMTVCVALTVFSYMLSRKMSNIVL